MTPQQIVGLAVRLFAIWLGVWVIQMFGIAYAVRDSSNAGMNDLYLMFAALFSVVAVFMWLFPMALAHRLVPRTHHDNRLTLNGQQVIVVACVTVGLAVIGLKALEPALTYAISAVHFLRNGYQLSDLSADAHVSGTAALAQLAVGAIMVMQARRLAGFILPPPPEAGADESRSA